MAKKFVAFLDILGFKDLVENNEADELINIYKNVINKTYQMAFDSWENGLFQKLEISKLDGKILEIDLDNNDTIKSIVVSDTIIIWVENDNLSSFVKIVSIVKSFLINAFHEGLPLRGCIDYDEIQNISSNEISSKIEGSFILLGKAITNAYQLEKIQDWAGCVLSKSAHNHTDNIIKRSRTGKSFLQTFNEILIAVIKKHDTNLIVYNVPLKKGEVQTFQCINWTNEINSPNEDIIRTSFSMHKKKANNWEVETKIKNTIDFYKYCKALEESKKA